MSRPQLTFIITSPNKAPYIISSLNKVYEIRHSQEVAPFKAQYSSVHQSHSADHVLKPFIQSACIQPSLYAHPLTLYGVLLASIRQRPLLGITICEETKPSSGYKRLGFRLNKTYHQVNLQPGKHIKTSRFTSCSTHQKCACSLLSYSFSPGKFLYMTDKDVETSLSKDRVSLGAHTEVHCKSVTSTATVCSTCRQLKCLAIETITLFPDCPSPVPTTTTAYSCAETKCPGGCASTSYEFVSPPARVTEAPRAVSPKPSCGAVTSTGVVCSTCRTLECVSTEYVTVGHGCPNPPATSRTAYECGGHCPTGCGKTSYITVATSLAK